MFTFWWPMFIIYVFWNDTSAVYVLLIDWGISVHQSKSAYIYIHIWNEELKSKTSGKIYMKTKYEIILQCSTFFFTKFCFSYILNLVKTVWALRILLQKFTRVLSTGEPCTCEYVALLQSFHRGALSIHWYIAQNF